jgi:hypothetical protein
MQTLAVNRSGFFQATEINVTKPIPSLILLTQQRPLVQLMPTYYYLFHSLAICQTFV